MAQDTYEVEFPLQLLQTDWIDILRRPSAAGSQERPCRTHLVQDRSDSLTSKRNGEPFRSYGEWQNLRAVGDREPWPRESSHEVEEEDHGDDGTPGGSIARPFVYRRAAGPHAECEQHTNASDQEQFASSNLVDEERESNRTKE